MKIYKQKGFTLFELIMAIGIGITITMLSHHELEKEKEKEKVMATKKAPDGYKTGQNNKISSLNPQTGSCSCSSSNEITTLQEK